MQFETNHIKIQVQIDAVWKSYHQFKDLVNKTLVQLEISIKEIIELIFPEKAVFNLLNIMDETQEITINQTFDEMAVAYNQINNDIIVNKTVEKIQKKIQLWRKKVISQIKLDKNIIPKGGQITYLFSEKLKFQSIKVNEDATKIQQTASQNHYCFAVTNQPFDNFGGAQTVTFKLTNQTGDVGFGFCDMEILKAKNFRPQLNILGSGVFICFQDRYIVNSNDATQNWVVKGFPMQTGDCVQVTFDPENKKMIWKKSNDNEGYEFKNIDLTKEYRACCVVKSQGCEAEILNE